MKRIITGLVLLLVGSFLVIKGDMLLYFWLVLVGGLSFYEVSLMTNLKSKVLIVINTIVYSILLYMVAFLGVFKWALFYAIILFYTIAFIEFKTRNMLFFKFLFLKNVRFFLYIFCGFAPVLLIRMEPNGLQYVGMLFLAIWACDIFALYGGRMIGRHQLSVISPKKTIEGTLVGMTFSMMIIAYVCYAYNLSYMFVIVAGFVALWGQLGDLYESLIKRSYNVKDSSNLLPGHGGVLDRADSTLFVFPLAYLVAMIFG